MSKMSELDAEIAVQENQPVGRPQPPKPQAYSVYRDESLTDVQASFLHDLQYAVKQAGTKLAEVQRDAQNALERLQAGGYPRYASQIFGKSAIDAEIAAEQVETLSRMAVTIVGIPRETVQLAYNAAVADPNAW